jgi:hypothetical protein
MKKQKTETQVVKIIICPYQRTSKKLKNTPALQRTE